MNEILTDLSHSIEFWFFVAAVLYGLVAGLLCYKLADEKGYGGGSWFIAGFFVGIFALIAAAGLPDKKLRSDLNLFLLREASRSEASAAEQMNPFSISPRLRAKAK